MGSEDSMPDKTETEERSEEELNHAIVEKSKISALIRVQSLVKVNFCGDL